MIHAAYTPSTTAVGSSLALTALLGLLPLVVFFVLLGVFKVKTHVCAIISLAAALAAAILAFSMPVDLALLSATQGAAFGLFPIVYIVIMAVWLYNLTEKTGRSEDVRRVFAAVGKGDMRVQALLIGFCFCGLMEGLAGFGAPVAISCAMLLALGVPAIKAALVTMVGNALNVCFGAMAIPVTTAAKLGNSSADAVGATQGRITPLFLCWIPRAPPRHPRRQTRNETGVARRARGRRDHGAGPHLGRKLPFLRADGGFRVAALLRLGHPPSASVAPPNA